MATAAMVSGTRVIRPNRNIERNGQNLHNASISARYKEKIRLIYNRYLNVERMLLVIVYIALSFSNQFLQIISSI